MVCTYIIKVGRQRSKRKKEIERIAQTLDQKYLLQEVLGHDKDPQEQFYAYLLRLGNKSMLEKISEVKENDCNIRNMWNNGYMKLKRLLRH